jgi:hypothetical protein
VASDDLFTWCTSRPIWQQEAIRLLATKGSLSADEKEQLHQAVRASCNLSAEIAPVWPALTKIHLKTDAAAAPVTVFGSIGPLSNIDRLAADQPPLRFALNGITLIYGANGSGKSGYCRIAKKVCHCLHNVSLRGNVFEANSSFPREITLTFRVAGDPKTHKIVWNDDSAPPQELARISVFDSDSANLYVDSERKIEFLPSDLAMLTNLAKVLRDLEAGFRVEEKHLQQQLQTPLPSAAPTRTVVSETIARLQVGAALPTEEQLRSLGTWTPEDDAQLASLISVANSDPALVMKLTEGIKQQVEKVIAEADRVIALIGRERITKLVASRSKAADLRDAAKVVASGLLAGAPLPNIGGETWLQMLQYARQFAAETYPDATLPQIATADICVLCQQPLEDEARERLTRFDTYIVGQANEEAERAKAEFQEIARSLRDQKIWPDAEIRTSLANFAEGSDARATLAGEIVGLFSAYRARHVLVCDAINTKQYEAFDSLSALVTAPVEALRTELAALTQQIDVLKQAAAGEGDPPKRTQMIAESEARKRYSSDIELFVGRRNTLDMLAKIKACIVACATSSITTKITQQRRKSLTPSLKTNLTDEIKAFDLTHLPIDLSDRGEVGQSKVQIGLNTQQRIGRNSDVLSEGEKRALGLAGFLAETKELGTHHGIIIDDPVSSLDHSRSEAVAKRLVAEADAGRQVIIFTHNLVFHYAVMAFATEHGVPLRNEWIAKHSDGRFGIIDESQKPWVALTVSQRLHQVSGVLTAKKATYNENDETCRPFVTEIYTKLRATWEHSIEEILFAGVIGRFRPEVASQRLRAAHVDKDDYKAVRGGMTRCSKFSGHDIALGVPPDLPKFDDLKQDFEALQEFVMAADARRKKLDKEGQEQEKKPIEAEVLQ